MSIFARLVHFSPILPSHFVPFLNSKEFIIVVEYYRNTFNKETEIKNATNSKRNRHFDKKG